jgi:hypothetical protein
MGARTRRFTSLASGSCKATAVIVGAVMLLAGCGGSAGSASDASTPVIRGDVAATTSYAIGSTGPGGGVVFYVSMSGFTSDGSACGTSCHYLEVSRTDLAMSAWCSTNTSLAGTTGTRIGTGFSNTRNMISGGCTSGAGVAARAFSGGGLSDWFLPSEDELKALQAVRAAVGGFATGAYYSSTQGDVNSWDKAKFSYLSEQLNGTAPKWSLRKVRPVRAF